MSDSLLETFLRYGTNAQRIAFTPDPPTVSGMAVKVLYEWRETDTGDVYVYDTAWHLISSGTATAITALTSDVTATGPGSVAATIANNAVTLAKIAHAAASSKLVGSGSSGSGANYAELSLGSGLSMSGTTLSATGSGGTVTNTGTLTSGKNIIGNGTVDVTVSSLTANLLASSSGTIAGATATANDKLVGSGNSGSGAAYAEITLGSGLTMTGTTLSASGAGGTVTVTGSPASGNLTKFSGASSVTNADLTGDVTTSGTVATTIANSAVTLAKIANAAANSKLVGSGASGSGAAYSEITVGTGLSMTGTTLSATGGSAGALILLEQHTASSSATLDFTTAISSTYDEYKITFQHVVPATDGSALLMRVNTGSGFDSGNNYSWMEFRWIVGGTGTGGGFTTENAINISSTADGISNTAAWGYNGNMQLLLGDGSTTFPQTITSASFLKTGGTREGIETRGAYQITTAVTQLRFLMSSGNISAGTIRVYGVAK